MAAWQWVGDIVGHHLIPCVLASAVLHVWLLLLFGPFRIGSARTRTALVYVAFLKAALALWVGSAVSCLSQYGFYGYFVLRLPNAIPDNMLFEPRLLGRVVERSELAALVFMGVLVTTGLAFVWRWARLAPLCRAISASRCARPEEFPAAFQAFDELLRGSSGDRSWLPRPRLMIVRDAIGPPFTMGIRAPIVVLSAELVRGLGHRQLQAVLAHELGHVRRFDYVGRWLAAILRDIMAWNPFVHVWYERLVAEQERASDEFAARLVDDPAAVASGLVEVAAFARHLPVMSVGPLSAWRGGRTQQRLEARLKGLEALLPWQRARRSSAWATATGLLGLLLFLAAQPRVALCLPRIGRALSAML